MRYRAYMHEVLEEHRDPRTDEINMTTLAEDCIQHFDIQDESVQEHMFEIAFQLANHDEAVRTGHIRADVGGFIASRESDCF